MKNKSKQRSHDVAPPRRVNVRFALIVLLSVLACAGLAHGVRMYQLSRNADYALQRAQQLNADGKLQAAIREYRRYLQQRPDDLDALSEMAELLEETAVSYDNLVQVYLTYEGILREDVNRDDVRRRTVDVALKLRKYVTALDHLELLKKANPNDPENFFERGQCFEGQGQNLDAAKEYVTAITKGPQNIDYYTRLVRLLLVRSDDFSEKQLKTIDPLNRDELTYQLLAETFMDDAVAKGQPQFEAYLARANFRKQQAHARFQTQVGLLERAAEDMQQALELAGGNTDVILAAADLALERAQDAESAGRDDEAQQHFQNAARYASNGLAIDQADLRFFLTLSQVELARDQREAAVTVLRDGIARYQAVRKTKSKSERQDKDQVLTPAEFELLHNQLLFSLADLLMTLADKETGSPDLDKLNEATGVIAQLPTSGPLAALERFLAARKQIVQRQWYRALTILQQTEAIEVPLTNLRRRIVIEMARCYQQLRNPDARFNLLRGAIKNDPIWNEARIALAATLADDNRLDEAIREYGVFKYSPGIPTIIVRLMIVRELSRPATLRNWSDARQMLQTAMNVMPDSPEIPVLRAELLMQQPGGIAEASELLKQARTDLPEDVGVAASSVRLEMRRTDRTLADRLENANQILDEAEAAMGDHIEFRLARAELAALQDFDLAEQELRKLEENLKEFTNNERFTLLSGLARIYANKGAQQQARRVWNQLAKDYRQNLMVRQILLRFAAEAKDDKARQQLLGEVRRIEGPDGPNGNYEEAIIILDRVRRDQESQSIAPKPNQKTLNPKAVKQQLDQARTLLTAAEASRPNWPAVPRALGVLEDLAGNRSEAFEKFERAIFLGDRSQTVVARVVQGLFQRKRYNEADEQLKRLQTEQPDVISGDIARLAWRVAWQRQQFDRAIGIARELSEGEASEFQDKIWQAQLNFARGRRAKKDVEDPLRDAVGPNSDGNKSPAAWFALIAYYDRVGRTEDATKTIAEAEAALPQNVAQLTAGRCFEMVGDSQQAEKRYLAALEQSPDDVTRLMTVADFYTRQGTSKQAEPYLEHILSDRVAATENVQAWARRRQALILAGGGDFIDRTHAIETLSQNIGRRGANGADVIADLRAKALLLAANQNRTDRLLAIEVYKEIAARRPLAPADRFRLAQLHDLTGDWDKAQELLLVLCDGPTGTGERLAYFVSALVRHERIDLAQAYLKRLKTVEPDTYRSIATEARLLAALDRAAEAVPLLKAYIAKRRTAAESLKDLLAQQNAQEVLGILQSILRDRLDRRGIQVIVQSRELLDGNQTAEAISLLTEYIDDTRLATASQAVLYRLAATLCEEIRQIEPAEEFFQQYVDESDNPRAVFLQATFLARQARLDDALVLCRQAHEKARPELFVSAAASVIGHGKPTATQLGEVRQWIQNVLKQTPDSSAATIALGDLYLVEGKLQKAEVAYTRVLQRDQRNITAINNLAWLLAWEKRDLNKAVDLIQQAIEQVGPIAALLDTRAMIHLAAGDPEAAIKDLNAAFVNTVSPYSALGHLHLAEAYLQAGDRKSARQMLKLAEQYGLSIPGLHPMERTKYQRVSHALEQSRSASLRLIRPETPCETPNT